MQLLQDYMALHAIPELDTRLPETIRYIQSALKGLGCTVTAPAEGSLCAFFDFGQARTLAFRADTDALPIRELTGLPYASRHEGIMHACGHDGHTAILLALARCLAEHTSLPHNILLIFQCGEETTGGALEVCRSGVFAQHNVLAVFGLHLWPGLQKGTVFSKPGYLMACSSQIKAEFFGKSCHIAQSSGSGDALAACCRFYTRAGKLSKKDTVLLGFGRMEGGTAANILCHRACLWGTVRAQTQKGLSGAQRRLRGICKWAAYHRGCSSAISFSEGYPPVCNDPLLFSLASRVSPCKLLHRGYFTTDDFSVYGQYAPGVYYLLGLGNTPPLHSSHFAFDPEVLRVGLAHFEALACQFPSAAITISPRLSP